MRFANASLRFYSVMTLCFREGIRTCARKLNLKGQWHLGLNRDVKIYKKIRWLLPGFPLEPPWICLLSFPLSMAMGVMMPSNVVASQVLLFEWKVWGSSHVLPCSALVPRVRIALLSQRLIFCDYPLLTGQSKRVLRTRSENIGWKKKQPRLQALQQPQAQVSFGTKQPSWCGGCFLQLRQFEWVVGCGIVSLRFTR